MQQFFPVLGYPDSTPIPQASSCGPEARSKLSMAFTWVCTNAAPAAIYQSNVTRCDVLSQDWSFYSSIRTKHHLFGLRVIIVLCIQAVHLTNVCSYQKASLSYLFKQFTMALPDRLPVMLAPASAMVLAVSLRLSRMAPIRSMWLPLALKLPVRPPTLPSPMLGLCLASATDVVSKYKISPETKNDNSFSCLTLNYLWQI